MIWDARRRCYRKTGVIALPIHLPEDDRQLFLVVSRPGYDRKPWYLITTEMFTMLSKLIAQNQTGDGRGRGGRGPFPDCGDCSAC